MLGYFRSVLKMLLKRARDSKQLSYLSWSELSFYFIRRAYHLYKGTFFKSLQTYKLIDSETAAIVTSYRITYIPSSMSISELKTVLRESFDEKHWHGYDIPYTPINKDDVVIDCGALEGFWASKIVNKCKQLYLIEPQKDFVRCLEMTFAHEIKNGRVKILQCAVGAADGRCNIIHDLVKSQIGASIVIDHSGEIPLCRIDTLLGNPNSITFIKADIEGSEIELIKGAAETIKRNKPKMALAVYHQENDWREIKDFVISIVPDYKYKLKGMVPSGKPFILHLWVDRP